MEPPSASLQAKPLPARAALTAAFALLLALGAIGFAVALKDGAALRAWEAFLVNLLFWLGIAQGGVVVSAAFYLTQARWGGAGQYRLAEAFAGFLPAGFVLFWALYFGRTMLFPWVSHPIAQKAAWLNTPFLFARDGGGLALMTLLSFAFIRASRSREAVQWAETRNDIALPPPRLRRLAPAVAIAYALVYSLLAFDLVMSLAPMWHSTLFGAYFFAGAWWSALAAMCVVTVSYGSALGEGNRLAQRGFMHDLGKLLFGFSVFWIYLVFSQYIPIWYADIPSETFFVVPRVNRLPWGALGWTAFMLIWAIPFTVLMGRRSKQTPAVLGAVALLGLAGIWLERYVLIAPSLSPRSVPLGWVEVAITLGFFGAFGLCLLPGLALVPAAAQPAEEGAKR